MPLKKEKSKKEKSEKQRMKGGKGKVACTPRAGERLRRKAPKPNVAEEEKKMSLTEEIAKALKYVDHPPPNESCTCEWVILPLLWAAGYERHEILSRVADNLGQFPDYTLLPDGPHEWCLEAKAWNIPLVDNHAQQSLNYINSRGRRWVVLTNGQIWRLYDNDLKGTAEHKLVVEVQLNNVPAVEEFLQAIGKESVMSGKLEQFAARSLLSKVLQDQLKDPNSEIVKAVGKVLKQKPGLSNVSPKEVAAYFEGLFAPSPKPPPKPVEPPVPPKPEPVEDIEGIGLDVLADQAEKFVTGKKPETLTCPGGSQPLPVSSWKELAVKVVDWLGQQNKIPELPFPPGKKCYFLNSAPQHERRDMRKPGKSQVGDQVVYIDTWKNSEGIVNCLKTLCEAVGVPPAGFVVKVKGTL